MEEQRDPAHARPPASEQAPPSSLEALVPKRRLWPVFAVLGLVVAAIAFFAYRELTATDPLRILVAIDLDGYWWEGSQPAAKLADELAAQLGELGFDPVKGGDPKVMKILEKAKDPKAAAKKLGAGFIIEAHLAPEIVEHPVKDGYFEVRVDAPVTLTYLDTGKTSEGRIRGYSGATKKDRAMALLADGMASQALDAVIAQLIEHPAVREITSGSDVKLLQRLNPAVGFAKDRTLKLAEANEAYASRARERDKEEQGKVTFLSPPAAEDQLVGVGGAGYFVKTADVVPFFSLRRRDLVRSEALETVEWRPLDKAAVATTDPAAPKPMWKGYHIFSYPSAQSDGERVALVEDIFGWAKTITIIDKAGAAKRVRIDPEHRFVDPKLAPGGKYVAVYDRPQPNAPADLMVLDTDAGKEVFGLHTENQSLGGFFWLDEKRLGFVYVPQDAVAQDQQIGVVDVSKQPLSIERPFHVKSSESIGMPTASRDGKRIACISNGSDFGVGIIDTATWTKKVYAVDGGASWPAFSPDGTHVVFETARDGWNVSALDLATGAVKPLTQGKGEHRLPQFSADGKRVLFEVRYNDPVFSRARRVSRIASVPFEP
jgi:hypothetical protein